MGVSPKAFRYDACEAIFNLPHGLSGGQTESVRNSKDVGIHGNRGFPEGGIQNHVGGFASDTRERLKTLAFMGYFTAIITHERCAGFQNIAGLGVVEADGVDKRFESIFAEGEHARGIGSDLKEVLCGLIDTAISGLGG